MVRAMARVDLNENIDAMCVLQRVKRVKRG